MYVYVTVICSYAVYFRYVLISMIIRGSFQKSCTLDVFSLRMSVFYKIHLQAFNVISIVLYHSGPTCGQVLYSCLDAFVVDASDYSGRLIRHLLNISEAFPTEWFLRNKSKSGELSLHQLGCKNYRNFLTVLAENTGFLYIHVHTLPS
jgi:hypothetical protein